MTDTPTPRTDALFRAYEVDMDAVDLRKGVEQLERELAEAEALAAELQDKLHRPAPVSATDAKDAAQRPAFCFLLAWALKQGFFDGVKDDPIIAEVENYLRGQLESLPENMTVEQCVRTAMGAAIDDTGAA